MGKEKNLKSKKVEKKVKKSILSSLELAESKFPVLSWEWILERFTIAFSNEKVRVAGFPGKLFYCFYYLKGHLCIYIIYIYVS
jgi:hypothetical protein